MRYLKSLVGFLFALMVGIVPAFFINFNAVFTDKSGSFKELIVIFMLLIGSYGLIGLIFGFIGRKSPLVWGLTLSLPAFIILALYAFKEPESMIQSLESICLTFIAAWFGAHLGFRLKSSKKT